MLASRPVHVKHISRLEKTLLACLLRERYSHVDMLTWRVEKEIENLSLISFLQLEIEQAPISYLRQLIRRGKVRCNGATAAAEQTLQAGDTVAVPESTRLLEFLEMAARKPAILYESDDIIIVRKPPNLATHNSKGHEDDNLVARVSQKLVSEEKKFKVAPIHRLDMPTSGPVIFGKGKKSISVLGRMMQENLIRKKYLALIRSGLPDKGLLASHVVSKGKVKHAETRYQTLEQCGELTLIELELETGRQHQIRNQLAARGFPIAGDNRYLGLEFPELNRLFLHCHFLSFIDPFNADEIIISDPLPTDLAQLLQKYGFSCGMQ